MLWQGTDVLQVPLTALFRDGGGWAVFVVADGRAQIRPVETGRRTDLAVAIATGLAEGETVIRYPNSGIEAGVPVAGQ